MPLFVDHVGLNSLVSMDLSTDNPDLGTNVLGVNNVVSLYTRDACLEIQETSVRSDVGLEDSSVNGFPSTGAKGWSIWLNLNNLVDNTISRYIMDLTTNSPIYSVHSIYLESDELHVYCRTNAGDNRTWSFTKLVSELVDSWNHLYVTWDGDFANDPVVYINGISLGSPASSTNPSVTGTTSGQVRKYWFFDSNVSDINNELSGKVQSLSIYSATLPSVSTLYNNGIPPNSNMPSAGLLEFWLLGNEEDIFYKKIGDSVTTLNSSDGSIGSRLIAGDFIVPPLLKYGLKTDSPLTLNSSENGAPYPQTDIGTVSLFYNGVLVGGDKSLVSLNLHRNGPYGYSTWKQLRVSENPITRHHKENSTMTFVVQPGPVRNVLSNGELRVRDRYSTIYSYTEPAIAQKAYPLVWNVGRHFKDENGNVDLENPERFSIISSYANQGIGFANNQVDKLHKFDPDEEKTEYREIFKLYAEGGLNNQASPLTHWEFLQYRETVFPHMKNQFQNENLERPNFTSFYRHKRLDRNLRFISGNIFGYDPFVEESAYGLSFTNVASDGTYSNTYSAVNDEAHRLNQSLWPLDEDINFLTRDYAPTVGTDDYTFSIQFYGGTAIPGSSNFEESNQSKNTRFGEGILMNTLCQYSDDFALRSAEINDPDPSNQRNGAAKIDLKLGPAPLYARRISLRNTSSVSNPSGMLIPQTGGLAENKLYRGGALWEAGSTRQIKDADGNYVSAPKTPFYDTYEAYVEEARRRYKNFSVVPEFRMSTQVEDYLTNNNAIELDMFDVTGGAENAQNSSQSQFYEIYSNSDFMRQFELINEDHKEFTNGKVLSLRCKAVKKFLPYEGFYPAQRTVDLAKRFYDSFKNNISLYNANGVQLNDFNFGRQMVMTPLFAPGVLFNTIKSGIAVDYPIITGSLEPIEIQLGSDNPYSGEYMIYNPQFDKRIPFEALIEPHDYLAGFSLTSNEPHPSGNLSASAKWDGQGDELYSKMANNFLAAVPEFFLPNGQLTSVVSKKQKDIALVSGSVYGMRVKMRRTMDGGRGSVYHSGSTEESYYPPQDVNSGSANVRESFTMYSRPSAFGPPCYGRTSFPANFTNPDVSWFSFDSDDEFQSGSSTVGSLFKDSLQGFNYPFTPPYYHGEAWCEIVLTASSDNMSISEIQSAAEYTYTRFDNSFYVVITGGVGVQSDTAIGPQSIHDNRINQNAVQLSASLNLQGIGKVGKDGGGLGGAAGNLVVDSAVDEDSRWIIQTKFETPMFNFNHISEEGGTLSVPVYGSESVPRGMWHQYGRIPEENEGVFLEVGPIKENWWRKARGETGALKDLSAALGFSGQSTKIGRLRSSKKIYEAVVAVPFIESEGRKKFFRLNAAEVEAYKKGGEDRIALTSGDAQAQIGRSVLNQMQKMEKYIFPPSFDFLNYEEVDPIAMYIFEFSHTLNQQDLADIWQNLPPDIGTEMEESEVAITHPLLKKELLGEGGLQSGNTLIDMPNKLKWMVFKVKQRAASNYFKKTVLRNPEVNTDVDSGNATVDEFGATSKIQYNWPYDYFSLVELVKLDAEVEFGNFRDEDIANYTDSIPPYEAQTADMDKIEFIVGGMGDDIVADTQVPDEPNEDAGTGDFQYAMSIFQDFVQAVERSVETYGTTLNSFNFRKDQYFTGSDATYKSMWDNNQGGIQEMVNEYDNNIPEEYLSNQPEQSNGLFSMQLAPTQTSQASLGGNRFNLWKREFDARLEQRKIEYEVTASNRSKLINAILQAAIDVNNSLNLNIPFFGSGIYDSADSDKVALYNYVNNLARNA